MCGLAGFLNLNGGFHADTARAAVLAMAATLRHRGPDDEGAWLDEQAGIALSHRRLSILDLSPAGHQPMVSACGRYVVAFNGEIYNHRELRGDLRDSSWRGHSDTETLLAAVAHWGVEGALERFVGMFVFALWDRQERALHLARDRFGEKPLYYGRMGNAFLFGSELKALRRHPAWRGEIDRNTLALYLRHNHIPAPYSIYRGISKLPPGALLSLGVETWGEAVPRPWWTARAQAESGMVHPFSGSEGEAIERLDGLLRAAIRGQMAADVPLGAFLSGGVDSSLVVALMQAQTERPVKTFTIGFSEAQYNEAHHARAVARHLGTDHTELLVTPDQARAVIPRLPEMYDEPFADSSQIPTFLMAQLARSHVAVSLSGDGGDELFGGYNRYLWADAIWRKVRWLPGLGRRALGALLTALPPRAWDGLFRLLPPALRQQTPGDKLHKLAEILAADSPEQLYLNLVSQWKMPAAVVLGSREPLTALTDPAQRVALPDFISRMMLLDAVSYLPGDILVKLDRAAMAVSLETRVPMLDHRVAEFAWSLPLAMKIRDGQGKWPLRQLLYRYVPETLIERPKMGFGVPVGAWLRGPLINWAEDLLDESRLREEGFFDPAQVRRKWQVHLSGRRNEQHALWNVLMFQEWLAAQKNL
jgi:asparagine synthase (glutamine-hydrolysing)